MSRSQRVLVVGGGLGIGAKVTEFLLQRHRARVVVLGLDICQEVADMESNNDLRIICGDITSADVRAETRNVVLGFMGGLDSLVCTVGIVGEIQLLRSMNPETIQRAYSVNVFAPMLLSQLFLPDLRESKGKIIIVSSAVDKTVKYAGWIQYCSTKAALTRFIEVLDHEQPEVRIYGVYPGLTRTRMVDDMIARKYKGIMKEEEMDKFVNWDRERSIDPPEWCASVLAKMSMGYCDLPTSGRSMYYHEYDPHFKDIDSVSSKL